jgi:hypothetical protein
MLRSLSLKVAVIAVALLVISQCPATWFGGSVTLMASAAAQPVSAQTSTISDPVGDALFNAPAFQDIVRVEMTKTAGGDLELLMEMAGSVPVNPPLPPPGNSEIWWMWVFDLDPTTFPVGYPLSAQKHYAPYEFVVYVSWDGAEFAGTAIDRRPLLTGEEAILTPVTFSVDGKILQADLPSALIGAVPTSFGWGSTILDWSGPVGVTESHHLVEFATFNP